MADLTHMAHRVPDGQGHPAEGDRRHEAAFAATRHQLAARVYVEALAAGDDGAAARHLHALQHDPGAGIDPWRLAAEVGRQALSARTAAPAAG
jgi:hypothetical protein